MADTTNNKYYYALGRRKNAGATVRIYEGKGESTINDKPVNVLYTSKSDLAVIEKPFTTVDKKGDFYFTAKTFGGGKTGQRDAIILGISRALVKYNEEFKTPLKREGLLTRDPRMVERKKIYHVKARKSPQFSKR